MPLKAPKLDDRTFEDLLREARLRIPSYCPEWTNFNDSDPGMALVQLFAWFTELMLFRMNQVPELSYIKFLELLNIQPRPQRAAHVVVCFQPTRPSSPLGAREIYSVPSRARMEVDGENGPVIFETREAFDPLPYPLDTVQVFDGGNPTDVSGINELMNDSYRPFGWIPQVGNALYLGFQTPSGDKLGLQQTSFPDRIRFQVFLPADRAEITTIAHGANQVRPSQSLLWEYQSELDLPNGERRANRSVPNPLARWRPLETISDTSMAFTREGNIVIRGPGRDILATHGGKPTPDDDPRFWLRCRLVFGSYPVEQTPEIACIRVNAVIAENLATYTEEVLGESDGFLRTFTLRNTPVDPSSVEIVIEPVNQAVEYWERQDDLLSSRRDSKHFMVNAATGQITFGNGVRGQVPAPGALVVARKYRAGGGRAGNIEANAITSVPLGVSKMASVTNPRRAAGGLDEETFDELREIVPNVLRGDGRAVCRADYERVASRVDGVSKVGVMPLAHPDHRNLKIPGTISVVVVPQPTSLENQSRRSGPQPSQDLLERVYRELDAVRPLTTELFVVPPRYRLIEIVVRVELFEGIAEASAREWIRLYLEAYLSPVPVVVKAPNQTTPLYSSPGWRFDDPLISSRLYSVISSVRDAQGQALVSSVTRLEISENGMEIDISKALYFEKDELPVGHAVVIVVNPVSGEHR